MTLGIVIATHGKEGLERVASMHLPELANIYYVISCQGYKPEFLPQSLKRSDIKIVPCNNRGLSNNRNNGIAHCNTDIVMMADDDIVLNPLNIGRVTECFEEFPDTDVATFMSRSTVDPDYPDRQVKLDFYLPKGYWVRSIDMAFRRALFPSLSFDIRFGLGSGFYESGEDELFHLSARKRGYTCRFFPIEMSSHPHTTTFNKAVPDSKTLLATGILIAKSYPWSFPFRIPLKAFRLCKKDPLKFPMVLGRLLYGAGKSFFICING